MPRTRTRLICGIAALVLCAPAAAAAQQAPADTTRRFGLDTVTVSVLGPTVPVRRAPYAVSAVSEDEIRAARPGMALDEALSAIPGVQVDSRYNYSLGERISVRGFGARAQFGVRGVRVLVDGIPATLPDGQTTLNHVDVAMLGRAEIIRGPAAALYGNASGGVIRLSTVPPPQATLATEYRVVAGSHGLVRTEGRGGGRSGPFTYQVQASRLAFGGYRDQQNAENLLAGATLGYARGADVLRLTVNAVGFDAQNPGSLNAAMLRDDRTQTFEINRRHDTGQTGRQGQVGLAWTRTLGAAALEVTTYATLRSFENPIPFRIIELDRRVGGVRGGVSGALAGLSWAAGAELELQDDDRLNFQNQDGTRGARLLDQRERVHAGAGFAHVLAEVAPGVDLMGALRYDRFRFSVRDRLISDTDPDDSGARIMDALSPTLGVTVAPVPALSLYANVATAFETPTTTELANRPDGAGGFNPELQPQRTRSWEGGARLHLGAAARLEAAAYHARVRGALIPFEVEALPGRQYFRNAGEAVHRGVEMAAVLTPRQGWTARAAYTWTDARFGEYVVGGEDLRGNRVPGIAPHRLELSSTVRARGGFVGGADVRRMGRVPVSDRDADGSLDSPAYTRVDLRGGWDSARLGRMGLAPFAGITNVLDAEYNTAVAVNAAGARFYEPAPGRSFYAGMSLRLGPAEAR
jgi:iron complex outermembrane recepter protein